jgi:hypothetical protein
MYIFNLVSKQDGTVWNTVTVRAESITEAAKTLATITAQG